MLFAENHDVVWQALIAALLAAYMEWSRRKAAREVENVKKATVIAADKVAVKLAETGTTTINKITDVADAVKDAHASMNGVKDELIKAVGQAEYARGFADGKESAKLVKCVKEDLSV